MLIFIDKHINTAMIEKALEALEDLRKEAQKINDTYSLTSWKSKATNIIVRIYGSSSLPEKQIDELKYQSNFNGGSNVEKRKIQAAELIDSLIKEIQLFGVPETKVPQESGFNITINQNQSQRIKINLSLIIESVQKELTGNQLKELQDVLEDKEIVAEEKKTRIVDKLKKFGGDVASNIIANILTNPNLYT